MLLFLLKLIRFTTGNIYVFTYLINTFEYRRSIIDACNHMLREMYVQSVRQTKIKTWNSRFINYFYHNMTLNINEYIKVLIYNIGVRNIIII